VSKILKLIVSDASKNRLIFVLRGSNSTDVQDLHLINLDNFPIYMYILALSYVNHMPVSAVSHGEVSLL